MLTLHDHPDNVFLCHLVDGKKKHKIMWHPRKDIKLRMSVDSLDGFNTERFRDRFKLSKNQADEIITNIKQKTTPEGGLQSRFFKVKKYLDEALYSEMDVRNSSQKIQLDYPEGNTSWGELELVCGSSGQGKTWYLKEKVKRCLDGPAKNRRKIDQNRASDPFQTPSEHQNAPGGSPGAILGDFWVILGAKRGPKGGPKIMKNEQKRRSKT